MLSDDTTTIVGLMLDNGETQTANPALQSCSGRQEDLMVCVDDRRSWRTELEMKLLNY